MTLKSLVMVSAVLVLASSNIRTSARDDPQMREVVRFIAEVQEFMARKEFLQEKSRSLIGGHVPCAGHTIRGLLGTCRNHISIKRRKHSALHGLKALLAKKKKANKVQKQMTDPPTSTTKTDEVTTLSLSEPVTIKTGLNISEELSANKSVTPSDPDKSGTNPTSSTTTIEAVISPFRKAISAVSGVISRIAASVGGSFSSSSDISGEQNVSQTTEKVITGTPDPWETSTIIQAEPLSENDGEISQDVVVTKIFEMLRNETNPRQSSVITETVLKKQHELAHYIELEEGGDGAEDTTVTPDITSDDPEMMQGRTDMTEAAESEANTELYSDMEDTTDSLLPPYEDVKPIFLQKQASEIEFLNDDGEIEIQKS